MGGKTVILSMLIMSLVLTQIQVEAMVKYCCQSGQDRNVFIICRLDGNGTKACLQISGCFMISNHANCPSGYPNNLENSGGYAVTEYCKLGCASSVCGALTTLQNSDASEIVNGAVEKCTKACSTLCTKGSKPALETA